MDSSVRISGRNGTPLVEGERTPPRRASDVPSSSKTQHPSRPALKKTATPPPPLVNAEEEEADYVRLPLTFPVRDQGTLVPGTTNLHEPPEGLPPPPPPIQTRTTRTCWTTHQRVQCPVRHHTITQE